jgi:hypothetical protein
MPTSAMSIEIPAIEGKSEERLTIPTTSIRTPKTSTFPSTMPPASWSY